jgi:hypothetical protein
MEDDCCELGRSRIAIERSLVPICSAEAPRERSGRMNMKRGHLDTWMLTISKPSLQFKTACPSFNQSHIFEQRVVRDLHHLLELVRYTFHDWRSDIPQQISGNLRDPGGFVKIDISRKFNE